MTGRRVLVVDDTAQIRMLLRLNLELDGFEVVEADDGAVAIGLLHEWAGTDRMPDLVTLDALMEPVDGWTTVAAIRRDPRLQHLPLLMITASVQAHQQARAETLGVDAFVPKPFDPQAVVELIEQLLEGMSGRQDRPATPDTA